MENEYGTVEHDGKTLTLTQQAFVSNYPNDPAYLAHAVDADGNDYQVRWECREGWKEMDDESYCCDWSAYTVEAK